MFLANNQDNLTWTVSKHPTYTKVNGVWSKDDNHQRIIRDDFKTTLGYVSGEYELVQNHQLAGMIEPLEDEGFLKITNRGSLQGGKKVFWQAELLDDFNICDYQHKSYITITSSHDGNGHVSIGTGNIRVICMNTFHQINQQLDKKFKHKLGVEEKLNLDQIFEFVVKERRIYQSQVESLDNKFLSPSQLDLCLDKVFGTKETTTTNNLKNQILHLYTNGEGNNGRTAYDLFSG